MTIGKPRPRLGASLLLLTVVCCGCAGSRVASRTAPPGDYAVYDTWVWAPASPGEPADVAAVRRRIETAVESELVELGLQKVTPADATLLLRLGLGVEEKLQAKDPFYAFHVAELIEQGVVILDFTDAASARSVWRGESRVRLRTLSRARGITTLRYDPVSEERSWPIPTLVEELLTASGVRESAFALPEGGVGRNARRALYRRLDEALPEPGKARP